MLRGPQRHLGASPPGRSGFARHDGADVQPGTEQARSARTGARVVILAGTVFTTWDIVLILLIYVGLPLLVFIALIVSLVMFVRRGRR